MTNAKRQANRRYDKEHYTVLAVKLPKERAENFRALCAKCNKTVNKVLSEFVTDCLMNGGLCDD